MPARIKFFIGSFIFFWLLGALSLFSDLIPLTIQDQFSVLDDLSDYAAVCILISTALGLCLHILSRKVLLLIFVLALPVFMIFKESPMLDSATKSNTSNLVSILNVQAPTNDFSLLEKIIKQKDPDIVVVYFKPQHRETLGGLIEFSKKLSDFYIEQVMLEEKGLVIFSRFSLGPSSKIESRSNSAIFEIDAATSNLLLAAVNVRYVAKSKKIDSIWKLAKDYDESWHIPLLVAGDLAVNQWSSILNLSEYEGLLRATSSAVSTPSWAHKIIGASKGHILASKDLKVKKEELVLTGSQDYGRLLYVYLE